MTGYVPVVVVGNSNIKQDIQDHGKIEECKIQPVLGITNHILYSTIYSENPERLNQQVEEKQQDQVCYKFPFQNLSKISRLMNQV